MIRLATPVDVPAVAALEEELFGRGAWSAAAVADEVDRGRLWVVGDVDGYLAVLESDDVADLLRIGVSPAQQGAGVGGALLDDLLAGVRAPRMLLEVSADNAAALALYASRGFVEIDRRRGYYPDGSDALVLQWVRSGTMAP